MYVHMHLLYHYYYIIERVKWGVIRVSDDEPDATLVTDTNRSVILWLTQNFGVSAGILTNPALQLGHHH